MGRPPKKDSAQIDFGDIKKALNSQLKMEIITDVEPIEYWVSTGSKLLDYIVSNKRDGGFPCSRICEVIGLESCLSGDTIIIVDIESSISAITIDTLREMINKEPNKKIKILTPFGFQRMGAFFDKGMLKARKYIFDDKTHLKATDEHLCYDYAADVWKKMSEFKIGDKLTSLNTRGYSQIVKIEKAQKINIYDIEILHKSHSYYTNNILSHNSGKSLIVTMALISTQKMGGAAILADTEHAASPEFMTRLGLDFDKLIYLEPDCLEDGFNAIEAAVKLIRERNTEIPITVVFDSVAGCPARSAMEADFNSQAMGVEARVVSRSLKKITQTGKKNVLYLFTNQMRQKIGGFNPLGLPSYTTPCGLALKFHSSVRIQLTRGKEIKNKDGDIIGYITKAKVIKSRIAPPMRTCEFDLYFENGIDDGGYILAELSKRGIIEQGGAWYDIDGQKMQKSNFLEALKTDLSFAEQIDGMLEKAMVIEYNNKPLEEISYAEGEPQPDLD